MLEPIAYGAAKAHADQVALGIGSMRVDNATATVYFTVAATGEEVSVTVPVPKDGVSIENVEITDVDGVKHVICTMSDGSSVDAGEIPISEPVLTTDFTPNLHPGSVKAFYPLGTSFEEILRDILTEKIPPAISMTLNPSTTLYDEVNDTIGSLTINTTVTKKTNNISKIEYYVNNTLMYTNTSGVTNGGSFPYIYNNTIDDDTTIKVIVTDTEGLSSTATKTINFIGRSYYGIVDPTTGEPTEALIKTLNKSLKNTKAYSYSGITCDYNKIVYAYPSELGRLTSIMDKVNNFNYTSSFQLTTITVDGIEYYVYTLIDPTGADNVTLTFE